MDLILALGYAKIGRGWEGDVHNTKGFNDDVV